MHLRLSISASSVPKDKLETISQKLQETLRDIVREGIDMERMQMVLEREQLKASIPFFFFFVVAQGSH
jgi:hypothetical protein